MENQSVKQATSTVVAKINNVEILVLNDPNQPVPIKPICEALGIDDKVQRNKISEDEILSSVRVLSTSTGSDGKRYEMFCLPYEFIFGWLFSINQKNVSPDAKENVIRYKRECYHALFEHFVGASKFIEVKERATNELLGRFKLANQNFAQARSIRKEIEDALYKHSKTTYQEYLENNRQLSIPGFSENEIDEIQKGGQS